MSGRSPCASSSFTAWAMTGFRLGMSAARSVGRRNGASAPWARATSATRGSSVETTILSSVGAPWAASSVWASSGRSPSRLMLR
jgi:hypothetical protein